MPSDANNMNRSSLWKKSAIDGTTIEGAAVEEAAIETAVPARDFSALPYVPDTAFWEWDVPSGACHYSPEWYSLLREMVRRPHDPRHISYWINRVHEDDIAEVQSVASDIVEGRISSYDICFRIRRGDDTWAWIVSRAIVSEKDNGIPRIITGVKFDVSRLRSDSKFQQAASGTGNALYHAMLENSPDLFVRYDKELFPLYINPVVYKYLGQEIPQRSHITRVEDMALEQDHLEFLRHNVHKVFEERVATRENFCFQAADNRAVCGEYAFWPEIDSAGVVRSAMTHFVDQTEQTRISALAKVNELRLKDLYELTQMEHAGQREVLAFVMDSLLRLTSSKSGFIFIPQADPDGAGRTFWSEDHYVFDDSKTLEEEFFLHDFAPLTATSDSVADKKRYRSVLNGDGVTPVHNSFKGKMPVYRSMIAPAMEGNRVVCVAGVCNKETDYEEADLRQLETFIHGAWLVVRRRRFVQELQRAKEAAERANTVKDEFLANISHELRTPLNGMLSMLQLLGDSPLKAFQREYLGAAFFSGRTLLRIISDILDYSRMESGKMSLEEEIFDLKAAVRTTLELFSGEAKTKGLRFSYDISEDVPTCVNGDEARLRQILYNLVGNALKFTAVGSIKVYCSRIPSVNDGKVRIYLAVADSGIGIPVDELSAVFDPFTQADNSSSRKYGGTGLGLGIVKHLVELMGGGITLESNEGTGTIVHCSLKFILPDASETVAEPFMTKDEKSVDTVLDILVAEDDAVSRFALQSFFTRQGHRALIVENGSEALEALQLKKFHCLFTDIQMPGIDGVELVERLLCNDFTGVTPSERIRAAVERTFGGPVPAALLTQVNPYMDIVAISAHAMVGDKERFLQQGFTYYVSKPVIFEELSFVVREICLSHNDLKKYA